MSDSFQDAPLIQDAPAFEALCRRLRRARRIAFDTEFVSEYTYAPQLCLIQIATDEEMAIIDPLRLPDVSPFWEALLAPGVEVVVHACQAEMDFCLRATGQLPEDLFDVQLAAGFVGEGYPLSYKRLNQRVLEREVAKGAARTDWRKRPLSDAQLRYALDDVVNLLELRDLLERRLTRRLRRDWLREESDRRLSQQWLRAQDPPWQRVSGAGGLKGQELAVLQALAQWRDQRARWANKPPKWILRDDLLMELARRQPEDADSLRRTRGLGGFKRPDQVNPLLKAIAAGRSVPRSQWHVPQRKRREEDPKEKLVVKLLSALMLHLAEQHDVASSLLGTTRDLEKLVAWAVDGASPIKRPDILQGWRGAICGHTLLKFLAGQTSLQLELAQPIEFKLL